MKLTPLLAAIAVFIVAPTATMADKVGITVDASKTVRATGGGKARIVAARTSIFQNDRLRANSSGNAQIRLIDGTKIVVGPNADVKIDEFVYRGGTTVERVTVSATRGAFRFISGRSKHSAYKIRTPNGTIGVRGTAFDVTITRQGTNIALLRGAVRACDRGGRCRDIRNRCDYVLIGRRGVTQDRLNSQALGKRVKSLFPLLVNETGLRRQFKQFAQGCTVARANLLPDRDVQPQPFRLFRMPINAPQDASNSVRSGNRASNRNSPGSGSGNASSPRNDPPSGGRSNAGRPNNPGNDKRVGNAGNKFSGGGVRGNSANAPGRNGKSQGSGKSRGKSASAKGRNK